MFKVILFAAMLASLATGCAPAPDRPTPTITQAPGPTTTPTLAAPSLSATASPVPTTAPTQAVPSPSATASAVPTPLPTMTGTTYGVSLSPRSYEQADFLRFLDLAAEAGGALRGGNQWLGLAETNQSADVVAQLAVQRGQAAVIETSFFIQESGEVTADVTDLSVQDDMIDLVRGFAGDYRPAYFGLAVEVNMIEESNPEAFDAFADEVFPRAVAAIKAVSPDTQVFLTFQLELLRGLRGGLFGGVNDTDEADWNLLDRFPDADLISFTTYPFLIFDEPSQIPDDYYSEILEYTSKPVAFTEIGWFGESEIPGWEAGPEEQAEFISRLFELLEPVRPELVMWAFLFDQQTAPVPFDTAGLFDSSGEPRPAWDAWIENTR